MRRKNQWNYSFSIFSRGNEFSADGIMMKQRVAYNPSRFVLYLTDEGGSEELAGEPKNIKHDLSTDQKPRRLVRA